MFHCGGRRSTKSREKHVDESHSDDCLKSARVDKKDDICWTPSFIGYPRSPLVIEDTVDIGWERVCFEHLP